MMVHKKIFLLQFYESKQVFHVQKLQAKKSCNNVDKLTVNDGSHIFKEKSLKSSKMKDKSVTEKLGEKSEMTNFWQKNVSKTVKYTITNIISIKSTFSPN